MVCVYIESKCQYNNDLTFSLHIQMSYDRDRSIDRERESAEKKIHWP